MDTNASGGYAPKLSDFGYSHIVDLNDERGILMPRSEPWHPPELVQGQRYTIMEAQNMDTFSFALLSWWFLFRDQKSFPQCSQRPQRHVPTSVQALKEVRDGGQDLGSEALRTISEANDLDSDLRIMLQSFYASALSSCSSNRMQSLAIFQKNCEVNIPIPCSGNVISSHTPPKFSVSVWLVYKAYSRPPRLNCDQVASSFSQLCQVDFRVRRWMFKQLQEIFQNSIDPRNKDIGFELAVCLHTGFSVTDNVLREDVCLQSSGRTVEELELQVQYFKEARLEYYSNLFRKAKAEQLLLGPEVCSKAETIATAYHFYKGELERLEQTLGTETDSVLSLHQQFAQLCVRFGRPQEAEEEHRKLILVWITRVGSTKRNPALIAEQGNLALAISHQPGRSTEAEAILLEILEQQNTDDQGPGLHTLRTLGNLAILYSNRGQHVKAALYYKAVADASGTRLGAHHEITLQSTTSLMKTYVHMGESRCLKPVIQTLIAGYESQYGQTHENTIRILEEIAFGYEQQVDYVKAISLHEDAMIRSDKEFGRNHLFTLGRLRNLASTYESAGKIVEAQHALELLYEGLKLHSGEAGLFKSGGAAYKSGAILQLLPRGNHEIATSTAILITNRILEGLHQYVGPKHYWSRRVLHHLAIYCVSRHQLDKAKDLLKRSLSEESILSAGRSGDEDTTATSVIKITLGDVYDLQGQVSKAEQLWQDEVKELSQNLGPNARQILGLERRLGKLCMKRGDDQKTVEHYERAIKIATETLGPAHDVSVVIMAALSQCHAVKKRRTESAQVYQRILNAFGKNPLIDTQNVEIVHNLGEINRLLKHHEVAERFFVRALEICESQILDQAQTISTINYSRGINLCQMDRFKEGLAVLDLVVASRTQLFGHEHPDTIRAVSIIGFTKGKQKRRWLPWK